MSVRQRKQKSGNVDCDGDNSNDVIDVKNVNGVEESSQNQRKKDSDTM